MLAVLTGGRSTGKTSVAMRLAGTAGIQVQLDPAREIVRRELGAGGDLLPWRRPADFTAAVYGARLRDYRKALALPGTWVFDRGIPDGQAFLLDAGLAVPPDLQEASRLRYDVVFWFPPWKKIYQRDDERPEDWEQAERVGHVVREVYERLGYTPILVPPATVEIRTAFILRHLSME